ncbi:MAG: hypothetical protein IJN92_01140 [Lachnospiraceae bacterium]|nr:hypothetical protein [Lachnospiraceae bacterium]
MNSAEAMLEFDKIKEKWLEFAYTKEAKEEIKNTVPELSESKLLTRQRETTEAKLMIEKGGNPPLTSMEGIKEFLSIAEKGGCLSGAQLEEVGNVLVAVKRLKDYLDRCKQFEISLAYFEENLDALDEVRNMIRMQIRNGSVDDEASKMLKSLRMDLDKTESKMKEKAEAVMRSNKECMSDNFCTMRNGHVCIPVKKEYKFKISGSVIDKSSTGNTLFIEPSQAAKYYEQLQLIRIDEENEERRILYTLTAMLADVSSIMANNERIIQKLDFIFSKGKLSLTYDGVEPAINTERRISLKDGRHPLMDKSTCVPLQFQIGNGIKGIIITGPNTGGKTVAIKTNNQNKINLQLKKEPTPTIQKKKQSKKEQKNAMKFKLGDSVIVYPDKKIGIVCEKANEKGVLRVQLQGKKIWVNHKRIKLHVAAEQLYPEDYDFSIIFDSVQNRKIRHQMERKYVKDLQIELDPLEK